jgi:hypothetical protein
LQQTDYYQDGAVCDQYIQFADGKRQSIAYYEDGTIEERYIMSQDGTEQYTYYYDGGQIQSQNIIAADHSGQQTVYNQDGTLANQQTQFTGGSRQATIYCEDGSIIYQGTQYADGSRQDTSNSYYDDGALESSVTYFSDGTQQQTDYNEDGTVAQKDTWSADGSEQQTDYAYYNDGALESTVTTLADGTQQETDYNEDGTVVNAGDSSGTGNGADGSNSNLAITGGSTTYWSDGSIEEQEIDYADGSQQITDYYDPGQFSYEVGTMNQEIKEGIEGSGIADVTINIGPGQIMDQETYSADGSLQKGIMYSQDGQIEMQYPQSADGSAQDNGNGTDSTDSGSGASYAYFTDSSYYSDGALLGQYTQSADGSHQSTAYYEDGAVECQETWGVDGSGQETQYYENGQIEKQISKSADGSGQDTYYNEDGTMSEQMIWLADGSVQETDYNEDGSVAGQQTLYANASDAEQSMDALAAAMSKSNENMQMTFYPSNSVPVTKPASPITYNADGSISIAGGLGGGFCTVDGKLCLFEWLSGGSMIFIPLNNPNDTAPSTSCSAQQMTIPAFNSNGTAYGFAGSPTAIAASMNGSSNMIVQYDLSQGDGAGAAAAQAAIQQAQASADGTAPAVALEGAKWNLSASNPVVTWSLADSSTPAGSGDLPFSGAISTQYQGQVQQAFAAWGTVTGIDFEQVADPAQADINLGWANFDTRNSGIVGYTSYQQSNGQLNPGVTVELQDPAQDALTAGSDGQLTYTGTQATLEQVLEHEIGHALGLADSCDPGSIMYYELTQANRTLDATDIAGAQALYGQSGQTAGTAAGAATSSAVAQLIQAMAAYAPPPAASSTPVMAGPETALGQLAASAIH